MKSTHVLLSCAAVVAATALPMVALAADHTDSPAAAADPAADLTDFYAWHTEGGKLILVLNYAGFATPGTAATYDAGVLYGFHVDRDGDNVADQDLWIRFGQDSGGNWGVQVEGLPGESEHLVGAVETNLVGAGGSMVYTGLRDDPFFFDFEGFETTLMTGTLSFDAMRDSFAGTNVTSIVLELDTAAVADGSENLSIWATTARK